MEGAWLSFQGLFAFFTAYVVFLLFAYKVDPRFSLKYRKVPSFYRLMWISTLETTVLVLVLVIFNFLFGQDLIVVFGLDRLFLSWEQVLSGFFAGVLLLLVFLPVAISISAFRRRYLPNYKSGREEEIKKLVFLSLPKSQKQSLALLSLTSLKAAIFEEIVFRGYLLNNLLFLTSPIIAIVVQAFLFFLPHLYQGVFNSILSFVGGLIFGLIFYLTGSLTIVIISHFTGDLIGLVIQMISKKGEIVSDENQT